MASPIFISRPPENFTFLSVLWGFQLAFSGSSQLFQNADLLREFCINGIYVLVTSLMVHILLLVARWSIKLPLNILSFLFGNGVIMDYLKGFEYFHLLFAHPHVFIITFINLLENHTDNIFMLTLKHENNIIDENTGGSYYNNLSKLSLEFDYIDYLNYNTYLSRFNYIKKTGQYKNIIRRHLSSFLLNLFVHLISKIPKIDTLVINFINFQCFHDKIGTLPSLLIIAFLNTLSWHNNFVALVYFWGAMNLSQDLLLPFFMRVKLTNYERNQWIKSREGILFGFGIFFFYLIYTFPSLSMLTYYIAQASAAYLVTKLSDIPPDNDSSLINWNSSQLVWNKKKLKYDNIE